MAKLGQLVHTRTKVPAALSELRIQVGATSLIRLFTDDAYQVSLHYGETPALKGYFHCLQVDCPYCRAGKKLSNFFLLPAFSIESGTVQVLRLPESTEPYSLTSQILNALDDPHSESKVQVIRRLDTFRYSVEIRDISANKKVGIEQISLFTDAAESGQLKLDTLFSRPSKEDMLADESVRLHLSILTDNPQNLSGV